MQKDLLVVTSKVLGSGHYSAAKNLYEGLIAKQKHNNIDFYDWDFFGGKAYEFMIRNTPNVWALLNETMQNEIIISFSKMHDSINILTDKAKETLSKKELWWQIRYSLFDLESFIKVNDYFGAEGLFEDKKPDWAGYDKILLTMPGTHSLGYSNYYADKSYILVTDYGKVDKAWTIYTPNTFFVANQATADYLSAFKDLKDSKIILSGIPVSPLVYKLSQVSKYDIRKKLGIKSSRFFVLAGGGAGGNIIKQVFNHINKTPLTDSHFLVVCGRNKELFKTLKKRLKKRPNPNIKIVEFMDNEKLLEYYRASDMVLTKPGGITITELIGLNTPIGVYYFHPQEQGNLEHIKKHRLGVVGLKIKDFLKEVDSLDSDDFDYFALKMKKVAIYNSVDIIRKELGMDKNS